MWNLDLDEFSYCSVVCSTFALLCRGVILTSPALRAFHQNSRGLLPDIRDLRYLLNLEFDVLVIRLDI